VKQNLTDETVAFLDFIDRQKMENGMEYRKKFAGII
jgi:hypothetical protein